MSDPTAAAKQKWPASKLTDVDGDSCWFEVNEVGFVMRTSNAGFLPSADQARSLATALLAWAAPSTAAAATQQAADEMRERPLGDFAEGGCGYCLCGSRLELAPYHDGLFRFGCTNRRECDRLAVGRTEEDAIANWEKEHPAIGFISDFTIVGRIPKGGA